MSEVDTDGLESFLNEEASKNTKNESESVRKGNEVFSGEQNSPIASLSREEYAKQELGLDLPVDAVPLPSRGLLYSQAHPLHNAESVQYRAMTAREEDILMNAAFIKNGSVITELLKSCLIDKKINVRSLLSGDQQAIMIAIRISGYGRMYEPKYECPKCKSTNEVQIDLADFNIKNLEIEPIEPGQNLFKFDLPVSKKTAYFKFLTVSEEERLVKEAEIRKKKNLGMMSNVVTNQLLNSLVAVDGNQDRGFIAKFVQNMPAFDSKELRRYIQKNQPSVETKFDFQCQNPECDHFENVEMPMTAEFFWPGS